MHMQSYMLAVHLQALQKHKKRNLHALSRAAARDSAAFLSRDPSANENNKFWIDLVLKTNFKAYFIRTASYQNIIGDGGHRQVSLNPLQR